MKITPREHARSHFARPTIPEEKWGTTRSLIVIGSQHQPNAEIEVLAVGPPDDVYSSNAARNIGVIFDETSFLHIRQIARIRRFLTDESVETLVHAVITCRLGISIDR